MVTKTLYHGTNNKSSILSSGFRKSRVSLYGDGVYFFQSSGAAKNYGNQVVTAKVRISKPFTFSQSQNTLYMRLYQKYKNKGSSFPQKDAINELFRRHGYDGLRFRDFSRSRRGYLAWVIPGIRQIKIIR